MIKQLFFILLISCVSFASSYAQELKIGYVNIELVLVNMQETKAMNQQLQTYQQKFGEKLQTKQQYAQTKFQEYQEYVQNNPNADQATISEKEQELMKLEEEIKKETAEAEQNIVKKQQDLLNPILENVNKNIKELADLEGYDYILNSVDGSGVSIILVGPEEDDITEKLMKKLGITVP